MHGCFSTVLCFGKIFFSNSFGNILKTWSPNCTANFAVGICANWTVDRKQGVQIGRTEKTTTPTLEAKLEVFGCTRNYFPVLGVESVGNDARLFDITGFTEAGDS